MVVHRDGGITHHGIVGIHIALADPGDTGEIPIDRSGYVAIVTAGAETRTVADPQFIGEELLLYMKTDAGDATITFSTAFSEAGQTVVVFSDVGQFMKVVAVESGSSIVWRVTAQQEAELAGPQIKDTQFTAAQLNDMKDTNIEVVPAPLTGFAAIPTGIYMFLDHGGTDFVQGAATDQFALLYNGGSQIVEIGLAATFETFIESSADADMWVNFAESSIIATGELGFVGAVAGTAIDMDNNGATDLTTGDGTMSVRVYYNIVPFKAFS